MLQFIVLGQIPGTHIQLTFAWFGLAMLLISAVAVHKLMQSHSQRQAQQLQHHFEMISLSSLDRA